jgi:hypothetical protein
VPKDKNKKDKAGGKSKKGASRSALAKAPKKAANRLQTLTQNPIVADIVVAALVSMAAALKDPAKTRRLADDAGEELNAMAKKGTKQGSAMWDLALDVGRRTMETLAGEDAPRKKGGKAR